MVIMGSLAVCKNPFKGWGCLLGHSPTTVFLRVGGNLLICFYFSIAIHHPYN